MMTDVGETWGAARWLNEFAGTARTIELATGDVLVEEGDEAFEVFLIRSGRLEAVTKGRSGEVILSQIGVGELQGEIAVVTGQRRTASLRASAPSVVLGIARADFEAWMISRPELADAMAAGARERIDRSRVTTMIEALVGDSDPTCVQDMLDSLEWRRLEAGTVLFRESDPSDAAYFIVNGRLLVTRLQPDGTELALAELGSGEIVGELGLLGDAPRSATVRAVRDTTLARFSREGFESLISRHAALAIHLVRGVMRRNERPEWRSRAASIAVVVTAPVAADTIVEPILTELSGFGKTFHLSSSRVDATLNQEGVSQLGVESLSATRLAEYLHQADVQNDHVLFEADPGPTVTAWSRRCVRNTDRVVLVMSASPDEAENRRLHAFVEELRQTPGVTWWLAVLHRPGEGRPTRSSELLVRYGAAEIVHLHLDSGAGFKADLGRLARLVSGHGIGIVLSGGGARGFAHIGMFRAMRELGIPVDAVGGASIGAPIGAGIALALEPDELLETVTRQFHKLLDYTVPVVSVLKGARIAKSIEATLGGWDIEDLWLAFYCVSTNLTASRLEIHNRGDLARAVRASVAIPGVLPPVPYRGDLLVDGGVLANLPVEQMRAHPGIGTVIAVNVAPETGPRARVDFGTSVSGWRALRHSIGRSRSPYPSLSGVLMRTMIVGSVRDRPNMDDDRRNDLYIEIDLKGVNLLAFDRVKPVAKSGYEAARPILEAWLAREQTVV